MSGNSFDKLPEFNLVSIRAVLISDGEDPKTALTEAGLIDAIAIPVVPGEDPDLPDGILGDGITANLSGVLETEQEGAFDAAPEVQPNTTRAASGDASSARVTTSLPETLGILPLAPARIRAGRR